MRKSLVPALIPRLHARQNDFICICEKEMFAEALADIEKQFPGETLWRWSTLAYTYGSAGY
jgi:hypothetical protein